MAAKELKYFSFREPKVGKSLRTECKKCTREKNKTIKQLQAMYDIKGPIKGRVRKKVLRKNRKLRVLGEEEQQEISGQSHGLSSSCCQQKRRSAAGTAAEPKSIDTAPARA